MQLKQNNRNVTYKNLVIGIYADAFNGKTGITDPYMNFLSLFGTPFLITPTTSPELVNKICDALIVPGGADVDSRRYNEPPHPLNSRVNVHYEYMDENILAPFIQTGKPVLGICRGFQTLNVIFGGSLYQNMSYHNQGTNRSSTPHTLYVPEMDREFAINTIHHQAVKELGTGLRPIGYSPVFEGCETLLNPVGISYHPYKSMKGKDSEKIPEYASIVEAFIGEDYPIMGVQYHPEEFNCPFVINSFDSILNEVYGTVEAEIVS